MLSKARLAENYARFGRADKCFCPHEDTFPLAEVNDVSKEGAQQLVRSAQQFILGWRSRDIQRRDGGSAALGNSNRNLRPEPRVIDPCCRNEDLSRRVREAFPPSRAIATCPENSRMISSIAGEKAPLVAPGAAPRPRKSRAYPFLASVSTASAELSRGL